MSDTKSLEEIQDTYASTKENVADSCQSMHDSVSSAFIQITESIEYQSYLASIKYLQSTIDTIQQDLEDCTYNIHQFINKMMKTLADVAKIYIPLDDSVYQKIQDTAERIIETVPIDAEVRTSVHETTSNVRSFSLDRLLSFVALLLTIIQMYTSHVSDAKSTQEREYTTHLIETTTSLLQVNNELTQDIRDLLQGIYSLLLEHQNSTCEFDNESPDVINSK